MPDAVQMAQRPVDLRCSPVGEPRMSCAAARVVERKSTDEFGWRCACGELTRLFRIPQVLSNTSSKYVAGRQPIHEWGL